MNSKEARALANRLFARQRWQSTQGIVREVARRLEEDGVEVQIFVDRIVLTRPCAAGTDGLQIEFRSTGVIQGYTVRKHGDGWCPSCMIINLGMRHLVHVFTGSVP